jgi:CheY-like chemotaxis protein
MITISARARAFELEKKEYKLGFSGSGDEAIALVKEQQFDVLLVDLKLPFINSFETYLAVKEIQPDIVAIIWTDKNQELKELTESALQNDAYTCVNKPLIVEDVLKLLDEVMLKKQVAG